MLLHLAYPDRPMIYGKWRVWKPGLEGVTLNLFIPTETSFSIGATLFRSHTGEFKFAYTFPVDNTRNLEDLIRVIDGAIQRGLNQNLEIREVQCSHYHMMKGNIKNPPGCNPAIRELFRKYRDVSFRRIHTRLNHAAMSIAFSTKAICELRSPGQLPRPAYLCMMQDRGKLHQFCHESEDIQRNPLRVRDDSMLEPIIRDFEANFHDDSNL